MRLILMAALLAASSCGGGGGSDDEGGGGYGGGRPPAGGGGGGDDAAFAEIAPIVARNCGKCHDGVKHPLKFDSASSFKGSKAKTRIANGSMPPPPAKLADDDKDALLAYLGG